MKYSLFFFVCLLYCISTVSQAQISRPTEFIKQPFDVLGYDASMDFVGSPQPRLDNGQCSIHVFWQDEPKGIFPIYLRDLEIDSILVNGTKVEYDKKGIPEDDTMHYAVKVPNGIKKGDTMIVNVFYGGIMGKEPPRSGFSWGGVYATKRILYAIGVGFYANYVGTTQHWLPCYDHPSDKARITTRITVPKGLMAIANGTIKQIDTVSKGVRYTWASEFPMATYLMTFAVDSFQRHVIGNEKNNVFAIKQDSAATAISFSRLPRMISALEKRFGPYPFESVGYVLTPTGSMEHQTMISIDENIVRKKDSLNATILHELSHQWFGDHVTPLNYGYSWLSESFATFSESLWAEELRGQSGYVQDIGAKITEYFGTTVSREGVLPLEFFPRASPSSNFPRTIYIKGAAVLGMLRQHLGDSVFFSAMRSYLNEHRNANATTEDFKIACEKASGKNLEWFFDQWVKRKGWPRIQIDTASSLSNGNRTLRLKITQVQPVDYGLYENVPLQIGFRLPDNSLVYRTVTFSGYETIILLDSMPEFKSITVNQGNQFRSLIQLAKITTVDDDAQYAVQALYVYPQPGNAQLTIEYPLIAGNISWKITDLQGNIIREWKDKQDQQWKALSALLHIDVSTIPSGSYFITMTNGSQLFSTKCSITH